MSKARLDMLEQRLNSLIFRGNADRNAMPMSLRRGRWYAKLDGALTFNGSTDAILEQYDIDDDEWQATVTTITGVRSYFGLVLPDEFPVQVEWIGNTWAIVDHQRIWAGKADGAISKGSTGTISLWDDNTIADTTMNVTALAWGAAITSGKIVSCWPVRGQWLVAPWEC